jgi:hypothetical protein
VTALARKIAADLVDDGVPVGVGKQPANVGAKPFVVIWPDAGVRSALTMKASDGLAETWVCHCVGQTPEAAYIAMTALTGAVYDLHRTVVDGRLVQYPEQLSALPLSRDDDVTPPFYDLTVEWRLSTTPA